MGKYLNTMQPCDKGLKGVCIDTSGLSCSMRVLKGKKYCGTMADKMFFDNVDSLGCCPHPGEIVVKNPLSESSGNPVGRLGTPEDAAMEQQIEEAQLQAQYQMQQGLAGTQPVDQTQLQAMDPQTQAMYAQQAQQAQQPYDPSQVQAQGAPTQ